MSSSSSSSSDTTASEQQQQPNTSTTTAAPTPQPTPLTTTTSETTVTTTTLPKENDTKVDTHSEEKDEKHHDKDKGHTHEHKDKEQKESIHSNNLHRLSLRNIETVYYDTEEGENGELVASDDDDEENDHTTGGGVTTLSFKVVHTSSSHPSPYVSIIDSDHDLSSLSNGDVKAVEEKDVTLVLDYPLAKPLEVDVHSDTGFSKKHLAKLVCDLYTQIYKEEDEALKSTQKSKYGIRGHDLSELALAALSIKKKDTKVYVYAGVDS